MTQHFYLSVFSLLLFISTSVFSIAQTTETCAKVNSATEDPTPAQITGSTLPQEATTIAWTRPALSSYNVKFSGTAGSAASHEGVDYVHNNSAVSVVNINAAAAGTVVYVREGCPESSTFSKNLSARECGAGWGNHIVIKHGEQLYTRYGHLKKGSILVNVGDVLEAGAAIAEMGNSGRSEVRHLHFELGTKNTAFNSCSMSQNFSAVYNPESLNYQNTTTGDLDFLPNSDSRCINSPNPFRNNTKIEFFLPETMFVELSIYSLNGAKIESIVHQPLQGGNHSFEWNAVSDGVYICQLKTTHFTYTNKMVCIGNE